MGLKIVFIDHEPHRVHGKPRTMLGLGQALNLTWFRAGEKGSKKIPSLRIEDWGFCPLAPFTVLSSKTFQ